MQVDGDNLIVSFQQIPAHSTKCWVIQKSVCIDKSQYPFTILLDEMLAISYKLHIVIIYPFRIPLLKLLLSTRLLFIILHQLHYPFALVGAFTAVRRIPHHHHHRCIPLDMVGFISLTAEPAGKKSAGILVMFLQRVGQVDAEPLLLLWLIACLP